MDAHIRVFEQYKLTAKGERIQNLYVHRKGRLKLERTELDNDSVIKISCMKFSEK